MIKRTLIIIYLFLITSICLSAQDQLTPQIEEQKSILANDSNNIEALKKISFAFLSKGDYDQAIYYGTRLYNKGYSDKDYANSILYSHICLGQAYVMKGNMISAYNNLKQAELIGKNNNKDSALCSIYNGLGLYVVNLEKDYYASLSYFFKGLEIAKKINYERLNAILLVNIGGVYYLKKDTAGLPYSLEAYELGHKLKDAYLIYSSATTSAYLYYLKGMYDKANQYIKEAEFIMHQNDFADKTNIYAIYGHILTAQGDAKQAIYYFKKAEDEKKRSQTSSIVFALHGYAQALRQLDNATEAISIIEEALTITKETNNLIYRNDLLKELSLCYEMVGKYQQALLHERVYQAENDSLFNADKERIISNLRIKYDTERAENENKQAKLELLQKEKKELLLVGILILIGLTTISLYYLYWRKNRFYIAIVRQNKEAIYRESILQQQINEAQALLSQREEMVIANEEYNEKEKYAASSLSDEKKKNLFLSLEKLMREEKLFKDNFLTKEKVADKLNTNRTYLSQVINEQKGETFTQYINNYRINEAVKVLSDNTIQIPLKALSSELGFNSMTTFYKLFQNHVGMTPTQYKEKATKL